MTPEQLIEFEPQTPTEYVLFEHIKKLEREAVRLRHDAGQPFSREITPDKEITINTSIKQYWMRPLAVASVSAVPRGQEVLVRGKPDSSLKHFEIGYFVHEDEMRSIHFVAERMNNLNQKVIRAIADIYKMPEKYVR